MTIDLGADAPILLFLVLIAALMVRRAYLSLTGTRVSPVRLITWAVLYTALFAFSVGAGAAGLPWYSLVGDVALVGVTAVLATGYVRRNVVLERRSPSGDWYYRLTPAIPLAYIGLFLVRLTIDFAVLNEATILSNPAAPLPALTPTEVGFLVTIDALFGISTGLLLGRSAGVYLEHEKVVRESPAASAGPAPDR